MRLFLIISILFSSQILFGQFYFQKGDSLSVFAKSGLKLRVAPNLDSEFVDVIPYRSQVITTSEQYIWESRDTIENRFGFWLPVKYRGKQGYVFSGFLSKLKLPDFPIKNANCHYFYPFVDFVKMNCGNLISSGRREERGFDPDKSGYRVNWENFSCGARISKFGYYEYMETITESFDISLNDFFNYWDLYTASIKECSTTTNFRLDISINKDEERIEQIDCQELHFYINLQRNPMQFVFYEGT